MWQLMWRNVRAAALNATLQLLVIYRLVLQTTAKPNNLLEKPALSASNKMPQLGKKLQVLRLGSQFSY